MAQLWFDVGKDRYTTVCDLGGVSRPLWFDVGKDR